MKNTQNKELEKIDTEIHKAVFRAAERYPAGEQQLHEISAEVRGIIKSTLQSYALPQSQGGK